jgi:hypothetical protein
MSEQVLHVPFQIGQTFWLPRSFGEKKTMPCPVCAGNRRFDVILGSGERLSVPCDGCGVGFDGPRGVIEEWDHSPAAVEFTVARVRSMHDGRWSLVSESGDMADFDDLCATEAEAMEISARKCAENHERNMQTRQRKRKGTQKAGWTVRYHREQIADLERQLAWHRDKVKAAR